MKAEEVATAALAELRAMQVEHAQGASAQIVEQKLDRWRVRTGEAFAANVSVTESEKLRRMDIAANWASYMPPRDPDPLQRVFGDLLAYLVTLAEETERYPERFGPAVAAKEKKERERLAAAALPLKPAKGVSWDSLRNHPLLVIGGLTIGALGLGFKAQDLVCAASACERVAKRDLDSLRVAAVAPASPSPQPDSAISLWLRTSRPAPILGGEVQLFASRTGRSTLDLRITVGSDSSLVFSNLRVSSPPRFTHAGKSYAVHLTQFEGPPGRPDSVLVQVVRLPLR